MLADGDELSDQGMQVPSRCQVGWRHAAKVDPTGTSASRVATRIFTGAAASAEVLSTEVADEAKDHELRTWNYSA